MRQGRMIATTVIAALAVSFAPAVSVQAADQVSEQNLADAKTRVSELESQKKEVTEDLSELDSQLVTTLAGIDSTNAQISDMEVRIQETAEDLKDAESRKDVEYNAMKKRIQYLYETGGDTGWATIFLQDGNIAEILTNVEYTQKMYQYDRECLAEYADTVNEVKQLKEEQESQKIDLETTKSELTNTQAQLEVLKEKKSQESKDLDSDLADMQNKVLEYQSIVNAQNEALARQLALQQQAAAAAASQASQAAGGAAYAGNIGGSTQQAAEAIAQASGVSRDNYSSEAAYQSAVTQTVNTVVAGGGGGSASGNAILAYAQQYLGGKYVYGGNSLTNGVDCSGFVQQVYKNFGVNTSRTSYDMANDGTEVNPSEMQPGDVLVYPGHVGIYAGDGKMINASDERGGIKYTNVDYRSDLQTVRRYINN